MLQENVIAIHNYVDTPGTIVCINNIIYYIRKMLSDEKFEANCNCGYSSYIVPLHVIVFWNGPNIL